jgi:hypothetical protein
MPTIQVRDVPEHIYRLLSEQAAKERRSLAQQAIMVLARGLEVEVDEKARRRALLASIKPMPRGSRKADFVKMIREDRQR